MFRFLKKLFESNDKYSRLKNVKPGDRVQIEWHYFIGGIGYMLCENNDTENEKILLSVRWGNYKSLGIPELQKKIFNYSDRELINFNLLNPLNDDNGNDDDEDDEIEETDISALQKKMNEALDKEEYELADKLQKQIDNLLKK